jgi:hypothetical protein
MVYRIRKMFEGKKVGQKMLVQMYRDYADVGDTAAFVTKAMGAFPRGNCGLASLYLKKEIGGKVVQGTYSGHNHTFLLVNDTVVDITADQFGGPKVYIGPLQSPWALKSRGSAGKGSIFTAEFPARRSNDPVSIKKRYITDCDKKL